VSVLERLLARWLGPRAPSVSVEEAYERYHGDGQALFVDVRQPVEHDSGAIAGAALVPLTELGRRLPALPRERRILTICRSGHRSPLAARRLRKAGFDVLNVTGGMDAWRSAGLPVEK
jgi:rhodanese-related sulfurtransferase